MIFGISNDLTNPALLALIRHCQSVISASMVDAATPSCDLNWGLTRLLCSCGQQPIGAWQAWYAARQWGHRIARIARRYNGSSIVLPHIRGQESFKASFSRTRLRGFRHIWTVSMSQRRMWAPVLYRSYIFAASSVATGSLRWTDCSGRRKTGW